MISNGIIFQNSCLRYMAGVFTLAPANSDLPVPFEFALCEHDTRKHRESGYILTAVNVAQVATILEQLFKTHEFGQGWEVRTTATVVMHRSSVVGSIYDFQHWTEGATTTPRSDTRMIEEQTGKSLSYQHILQVCAMPRLLRKIAVPTPGVIDAPYRPRKELPRDSSN